MPSNQTEAPLAVYTVLLQCQLESSQLNIKDYSLCEEMKLESLHQDIYLNI